ncbi:MAG: hypothetical protein AB2L20_14100 [Mangrovibacterium sp.]
MRRAQRTENRAWRIAENGDRRPGRRLQGSKVTRLQGDRVKSIEHEEWKPDTGALTTRYLLLTTYDLRLLLTT